MTASRSAIPIEGRWNGILRVAEACREADRGFGPASRGPLPARRAGPARRGVPSAATLRRISRTWIVVVASRCRLEFRQERVERLPDRPDGVGSHPHDRLVAGPFGRLVVVEECFVQALAGSQARVHDRDPLRVQPGKTDQVPGQVHDLDRLAHVQDVDVAAHGRGPGLQDERDGFRDRHEVAGGVGMRDGQGEPVCDLALEERDDAAARAQDVAEPHGHVRSARSAGAGHGQQLRQPLGRSHRADRLDGLVGGDEHEPLDAEPFARRR